MAEQNTNCRAKVLAQLHDQGLKAGRCDSYLLNQTAYLARMIKA